MNSFPYVKKKRDEVTAIPGAWVPLVRWIIKRYTAFNVWVFKTSRGRWLTTFPGGSPICIVGMVGRKSGRRREVGLIHIARGDDIILVASQGGLDRHPVWYHNLVANPDVDIMVAGGATGRYRARQVDEAEKAMLWPRITEVYPDFDEYQARTDRAIPVFVCAPQGAAESPP